MSQHQAASQSETDTTQAPLDFNLETLQDLDIRDSAKVKGGAGVASPIQNPSGGRMTSGTSVIIPGTYAPIGH